ncbi:MAG: macro domain-containing protein [Mangrovibacterium sp.]
MIRYILGNILESDADALVNTVNTDGVMGKGIALQFKRAFPHNYKIYRDSCKNGELAVGKLLIVQDENLIQGKKWIINFPTKTTWKKPSEYKYIEKGLDELIRILPLYPLKSIALPPLGSGNGGLDWNKVKKIIEQKLEHLPVEVIVYEPNIHITEVMKKERVKLTEARAMLLYLLYQLVRNGEFVSEFSSEKICYFLQRFGAEKYFRLSFQPNFYGPYSGKVRYVLNYLNGSYIMGYSDMNKRPFDELRLVPDGEKEVVSYIENRPELNQVVRLTNNLLTGFYSNFGLELLSTIDYLIQEKKTFDTAAIKSELQQWSNRKHTLFSNEKYIDISLRHLQQAGLMN